MRRSDFEGEPVVSYMSSMLIATAVLRGASDAVGLAEGWERIRKSFEGNGKRGKKDIRTVRKTRRGEVVGREIVREQGE